MLIFQLAPINDFVGMNFIFINILTKTPFYLSFSPPPGMATADQVRPAAGRRAVRVSGFDPSADVNLRQAGRGW